MSDGPPKRDVPGHDVVLVHGRTEDGEGLRALRSRPGSLGLAELRPIRDGQPLTPSAELVRLREREDSPFLWDVEVQYSAGESSTSHEGPARVSTKEYRRNWDQVFAPRPKRAKDEPTN